MGRRPRVLLCLLLPLLLETATAALVQQLLARVDSSLQESDWLDGGSCHGSDVEGCQRDVVYARGTFLGQPYEEDDCGVMERSGGDNYTAENVTNGATLEVLHTCESEGTVLPQGTDSCDYLVCASFSWISNGTLFYEVVVSHFVGTGLDRTVSLDVYLNYDDEGGAPETGESTSMQCSQTTPCWEATECRGNSALVQVLTFDSTGDGWSDPFGNATEVWTLTGPTGQWSGNLMAGHEAARSTLCLPDGDYDFSAPGAVSWPNDVGWMVCSTSGYAGQAVVVTVSKGTCSVPGDVVQVSPLSLDEPGTGDDSMCDASCAEYAVTELEGSLIGVYSEPECDPAGDTDDFEFRGSGGGSGCIVDSYYSGAQATCRFCVVNRELWVKQNPGARDPDWPDCPCCVSDLLGVECTTVDVAGDGVSASFTLAIALGSAVALALCVVFYCCYSAIKESRTRSKRKAASHESSKSIITELSGSSAPLYGSGRALLLQEGARAKDAAALSTSAKSAKWSKLFRKLDKNKNGKKARRVVVSDVAKPMARPRSGVVRINPEMSRGAAGAAIVGGARTARSSKDPRDFMPDPDFDMLGSDSSATGSGISSSRGVNPMYGCQRPRRLNREEVADLYGVLEEGDEEEGIGVHGTTNPLFDSNRAPGWRNFGGGPRQAAAEGAASEGQDHVQSAGEYADALYSGAEFERSKSFEPVGIVTNVIPKRFLPANRGIQHSARDPGQKRRDGQAGHQRRDDEEHIIGDGTDASPDDDDNHRTRCGGDGDPSHVDSPSGRRMPSSSQETGWVKTFITPNTQRQRRRSGSAEPESVKRLASGILDDGAGVGQQVDRRRGDGERNANPGTRASEGGGRDAAAPMTPPSGNSRPKLQYRRSRSFESESSFKSIARSLADSVSFGPGRERFQVAPRSSRPYVAGCDEEDRGRKNVRRAAATTASRNDEDNKTSNCGRHVSRGRSESSSRRRERRHGVPRDSGASSKPGSSDVSGEKSPSSATAVPKRHARHRPRSTATATAKAAAGSTTCTKDWSIPVPTIKSSSMVARPAARLSDVLAGNVASNGSMRRGSSGKRPDAVPFIDLRSSAKSAQGEANRGHGASSGAASDAPFTAAAVAMVSARDLERPRSPERKTPRSTAMETRREQMSGRASDGDRKSYRRYRQHGEEEGQEEKLSEGKPSSSPGTTGDGSEAASTAVSNNITSSLCAAKVSAPDPPSQSGGNEPAHIDVSGGGTGRDMVRARTHHPPESPRSSSGGSEDLLISSDSHSVDGGSDTGSPKKDGSSRGRKEYRQGISSRLRERSYQERRLRSRGSSRSITSLQRVEEVSDESLSSSSPHRNSAGTGHRGSGAVVTARLAQMGRGRRLSDNAGTFDDDACSRWNDALPGQLEHAEKRKIPVAGGDGFFEPSTDAHRSTARDSFDASVSLVSPSSAPRYRVSEIKMSGNAAAVAADKRRRSTSEDDELLSEESGNAPLQSPPLPAFVSRVPFLSETTTASHISREAQGLEGAGASRRASWGPGRRQSAKIRRAMVLAMARNNAHEGEQEGAGAVIAGVQAGTHMHSTTSGDGRGGDPQTLASKRPTSLGVSDAGSGRSKHQRIPSGNQASGAAKDGIGGKSKGQNVAGGHILGRSAANSVGEGIDAASGGSRRHSLPSHDGEHRISHFKDGGSRRESGMFSRRGSSGGSSSNGSLGRRDSGALSGSLNPKEDRYRGSVDDPRVYP